MNSSDSVSRKVVVFRRVFVHSRHRDLFTLMDKPSGHRPLKTALCSLLALQLLLPPAMAQSIIPDGRTLTDVESAGGVTTVTTSTTRGQNAFNFFSEFNVESGITANMMLPDGTVNLINLVRGNQTVVDGVLNSIKDGSIGGNVYFANPNGFLISSTGIVNVGSLSLSTPTAGFIDSFFLSPGNPDDAAVSSFLSGTAPRNGTGGISVLGKINAIDGVMLSAGTINVGGSLYSGAHFIGTEPDFTDVVNVNGLEPATNVVAREGRIEIVADSSVNISGVVAAPGSADVDAGDIEVRAGGNVGQATVSVINGTIKGKNVSLKADAAYDNSGLAEMLPLAVASAVSKVEIDSGRIDASENLTIEAGSIVNVSAGGLSPLGSIAADSAAVVDVRGDSVVSSGADTRISADSTVTAEARPGAPDALSLPGDAGAAINVVASKAEAHVGGESSITAGGVLDLTAGNAVTAITTADASAQGAIAVGGTVALSEISTVTKAYIDETAETRSDSLNLEAYSANTVTTSAKAASQGATKQNDAESMTEETLAKYEDEASTAEGSVDIAAAVAIAHIDSTTEAYISSTAAQNVANAATVSAQAGNVSEVSADGSSVSGAIGVGSAVGINIGTLENRATVGDNAVINSNGLTVRAEVPTVGQNSFVTSATSGAGDANVGVAGSLAVNTVTNTTAAVLQGDLDENGTGATVNAGTGDVLVNAQNATTSTVAAGADVKGSGEDATVGVGASVGMNVAVNTTTAEIADLAKITGGNNLQLNAASRHVTNTEVTGGASGASVAVTPTAAVTVAVNTTTARIGDEETGLNLTGAYSSKAEQDSSTATTATGQTQGDNVAVGASLALTTAVDTVTSSVERDIAATGGVTVEAESKAVSSASATASVKGGEKADDEEDSSPRETVDEKLAAQGNKAKEKVSDGQAQEKLNAAGTEQPKAETSEGGVSVAAAVGVNVGVASTAAAIGRDTRINSGGALEVSSRNETDTTAMADGSQVDGSNTDAGVGAAVALNAGVSTNTATIGDDADVTSDGATVAALNITDGMSDSKAEAKSGAGARNVGVAGSLALNTVVNTTRAGLEGDADGSGQGAKVNAGNGDVLIEAGNATTSTAKAGADVEMSGDEAKVGVGASVGINVAVNTTTAEVADQAVLEGGRNLELKAAASHTMQTEVEGGAAGASVSITPVAAASIAVNTTGARLGQSATGLNLSGTYTGRAEQTSIVNTKSAGQAEGDAAVGASLGAAIAVDTVSATIERDINSSTGIDLSAKSDTSITTEVKAGAKGAEAADKDDDGNETPEAGTTVDEQKKTQLDFAKSRNTAAADVNTDTPKTETPDTTNETPSTDKPEDPPVKDQEGKKISVAAAIGASVAYNQAEAAVGFGRTLNAGAGDLRIAADTDTNYRTQAAGEAVSDDTGVAAAVALTATYNSTQASLGAGSNVTQSGDVEVMATAKQNRGDDFRNTMSAEAVSGAGGGDVAAAGALALVGNYNETRASIGEGTTIGADGASVGNVSVKADETSKISAQARAGALSKGDESKAGVGASFAVLLSHNDNTAAVGYDADGDGAFQPSNIFADSLAVEATKNRVWFETPTLDDAKNFVVDDIQNLDFDALDPSNYLGSNNYYAEAIAGAAAQGDAAVSGAFAVNVFGNTTEAYVGENVNLTTGGSLESENEKTAVEITAQSDTQAISFTGAVAGAKKAGVGISNSNIVNLDQTLASVGSGSVVKSNEADAGIKVDAEARQDIAVVSVSAGGGKVGVGGVLGTIVGLAETKAEIAEDAEVKSKGDVTIQATADSTAVLVSGGVGGGKEVGVGASVAANILANRTSAEIGRDAEVSAGRNLSVHADADETAVTAVVAGAGAGKAGVAGAVSINAIFSDTRASVDQGAQLNTDAAYSGTDQIVSIGARDDTVIVGISGGGAGGGKVGVGAALDTTVLGKTVTAGIADDTADDGRTATVNASKDVVIDASSSESLVSTTMGFAGGGSVGVGGAVSVGVVKNDIHAYVGESAHVDADGNVLINAQDDISAVMTAGAGAGGGNTGVGGSLAVATLLGSTKAYVGDNATVNARGNRDAATVYAGETVVTVQPETPVMPDDLFAKKTESAKGLSVTAYNRENLVTTVVGGAGGGTAGVAATVSANVIASQTEASIGRGAKINESNGAAGTEQQVRVKAVDETLLINTAGAGAGGGSAGVGASANVGVVSKTTSAWIGQSAMVNARDAVELDAASSSLTFSTTAGFAGGGSAGVGGSVAGVGLANTTTAYIEDATSSADAARVNVSEGDLTLNASDLATSSMLTGAGAGGGAAGVGGSLSVGVNASTTKAKIGDYAETNAAGDTTVHADSTENVNAITVAGAGGGSAGVSGTIGINVVVSKTEAAIGDHAKINQGFAGQNVDVEAIDRIITVGASGAGAGGGAAGVGGTANVTVALNTTSAYIGNGANVDAVKDVAVAASSDKYVNSAVVAGAGGGAAGVAGAVSILSVGSLLDGEAKSGLVTKDENGDDATVQHQANSQLIKSAVGDMLGSSDSSLETKAVLDSNADKLGVSHHMADSTPIPLKNTQAFIGFGADVNAGEKVTVEAADTTTAIIAAGGGAGGGAAGVAGTLGVVLLHDSAEAFIADSAKVDAGKMVDVSAETGETVVNTGITGCGGSAAGVCGSSAVNVVSSETAAYIGAAEINQRTAPNDERSVRVNAGSRSDLMTVAGSGGGAGAASVGGILDVNTLFKNTKAFIGEGASVAADRNVTVSADSTQNVFSGAVSVRGAGAAAVGGAASVNVIDNDTEAFIGSANDDESKTAAEVDSDGNVVVSASDGTLLIGVSASGTGAGAAAVGAAVAANVISSRTRAYVGDNSIVNARGSAPGAEVYDGTVDDSSPASLPELPEGETGDVDFDGDGVADGSISGGATFNVKAESGGDGDAETTVNPSDVLDSDGNEIAGIGGGLGARGTDTVKGLSVTAVGNQKVITTSVGVAGAGAAGVTGSATADVITSVTEAVINDGAQINQSGDMGADRSVKVLAADNSFVVMTAGTVAGAGAAAISGANNTAVVNKQTSARIGAADVDAKDVDVRASAGEDVYLVTTNASVAGAAGVGAAVGVGVIGNETLAGIGTGAVIDATGNLAVRAEQDSDLDIYTVAGSGGVVGISGAISVGVVENTTRALVEGSDDPVVAANLNAGGRTEIAADSVEEITSGTVSAAGGGVGVAGAVGVKIVSSETTASIGDNTRVNQERSGESQDVAVRATDVVRLRGGGGAASVGALYGAGATSETNIVRNTTTAVIGDSSLIDAGRDVLVAADSTRDVQSAAVAAAGGGSMGIGGAVAIVTIGSRLDDESQNSLRGTGDDGESGDTASYTDERIKEDNVSGEMGDSEYAQSVESALAEKAAVLDVKTDMNETSKSSLDRTRAYIGAGADVTAGRDIDVSAGDKTDVDIVSIGAAGGAAGIGGAVGIGITNSTTEAFAGQEAILRAGADISITASGSNVDDTGSTVVTTAGAGGIVGLNASVAVFKDTNTTRAYLDDDADVQNAAGVTVAAASNRAAATESWGASAGALAIGASISTATFTGTTDAHLGNNARVRADALKVDAEDASSALARARAGAAGVASGSGAVSVATIGSTVEAYTGNDSDIEVQNDVAFGATSTAGAEAEAIGVNVGAGAIGASVATATSGADVAARIGERSGIRADSLDINAARRTGGAPTAVAKATGAAGGLLLGANATVASADATGSTEALIGDNSTLEISGATTVKAENESLQAASATGVSLGFVSVGANFSHANSDTTTRASLGDGVQVSGGTLQVIASGKDSNYAHSVAGSGGLVSAPFSAAHTNNTSFTYAGAGSGHIAVDTFQLGATHDAVFDSWINNTNASLAGVSGAKTVNVVNSGSEAHVDDNGYIEAGDIMVQAGNRIEKSSPGAFIPGLGFAAPSWNVNSSSGGLADVPAAEGLTTISNNALVSIGEGAHIRQTGLRTAPGLFTLDAWNSIKAVDKVKMSSGGAVSAASASSAILADTNNATVRILRDAELESLGDMALGTLVTADAHAQVAVDVYGAVGVAPAGDSVSRVNAANSIEIGEGVRLESLRDINLIAGANTANQGSSVNATARTDVYNNTAIPVERDPLADAVIQIDSSVDIGSRADIAAVRNVTVAADEGATVASGIGIGKDIYREALAGVASAISNAFGGGDVSFETRTGRSIANQTSDVVIEGDVRVGIQRKQHLEIGMDGTVTSKTDGISITDTGLRDIAADIQSRIHDLEKLIEEYKVADDSADASIAVAAYESEISFLRRKLKELGFTDGEVAKSPISPLQAANDAINGMTTKLNGYLADKAALETANTDLNDQITQHQATIDENNATIAANLETIDGLDPDDAEDKENIEELEAQNAQLSSWNETLTNTIIPDLENQIAVNTGEIGVIEEKIDPLNEQIANIQAGIDNDEYGSEPAGGPIAKFLTVSDVTAQLGNIYIRGDNLSGSGKLDAPGDAEIRITNNSPSFLVLKNLTIPAEEGGKVYFNGVDVNSNADINSLNGSSDGAAFDIFTAESGFDAEGNPIPPARQSILIESKYDPLDPSDLAATPPNTPALAPDIILQGDISNLRGLVKIDSAAGSIRLEQKRDANNQIIQPVQSASIRANDVDVETRNGDFVQSYTNTYFHAAGAPLTVSEGDPNLTPISNPGRFDTIERTPETAGAGIVANGSVLIAARYLNINGNIQSGIPEWGVRVPADAAVMIPGIGLATFDQARLHYNSLTPEQRAVADAEYYNVSGATVDGLAGNMQGSWEKISVRYNARENRLELGGVTVQGGYIELFGQIFNTNNQGGGKLRVLDGYGQIKVDNGTDLPLWVNTLDTGRGVKGEIRITNIIGIDADGTPVTATSTYTRDPGGSRDGGFYNPASGLRYAMSVGSKTGRIDNYRYSAGAIVGIEVFPTELDKYWISGYTLENDPMARGEFLGVLPNSGTDHYFSRTQSNTTTDNPVVGRTWFNCNWWTLCAYGTYYKEFSIQSATKTVTTDSVRADYPIGIEFIGFDRGKIDVSSTGDVVINGMINNRQGDTHFSSSGSITQQGNLPIVRADNVRLTAGTGIGVAGQSVQVNVNDGGRLDAYSDSGEIRLSQVIGDLRVGAIGGADVSNVVLEAERNLLSFNADSVVQGRRVELLARNGSIGTLNGSENDPLVVRTGYTTSQSQWPNNGLKAFARDSINIRNEADVVNAETYSGNLLLISAESQVGDVRIETTGKVIDNNPFETIDTRTQQELADLWDSLRLRGALAGEKADEAVAAYRNGKNANYALYWQMRRSQSDGGAAYDPDYRLTAAERDALSATGMDEDQINRFEADRRTQYRQLHAEVGSLTDSFVEGYSYKVSEAEEAQIRKGSSWTEAQLRLPVGIGLLRNITDTVTTIQEPNAKGRNVMLVAGTDIGSYDEPVTIDLDAGLDAITIEQKAVLAAAERGDATVSGNTISIVQPRSVNVAVGTGALTAMANGDAVIGSEQDLRIDQVSASGDIRIKAGGSLVNASNLAGAANVVGNNLILEAANGGIGSLPDYEGNVNSPFRVDITGALTGRAANDIWIEAEDDLIVDTIYSRGDLRLDAGGSIVDAHAGESAAAPEINLRARSISLTSAAGSIGELTNPLDMGVDRNYFINASAGTAGQGIHLNGTAGEYFNIGSIFSGDAVSLSSATDMVIDGAVTGAGPFTLTAGNLLLMTPEADVHATAQGVFLRANELVMQDARQMSGDDDEELDSGDAARIRTDAGTIDIETVGNAWITGIESGNPTAAAIRVVSTEGRILDSGDTRLDIIADTQPDARLTINGALGIGDNPLDVRVLNLDATSGGVIDLAAQNNLNVIAASAADRIWLTATGDITGDAVTSTGTGANSDKSVLISSASGNVDLNFVSGQSDVIVNAPMSLSVGRIDVGGSIFLASDRISAAVNGIGNGDHGGSVTGYGGGSASYIDLGLSSPSAWRFSSIAALTGNISVPRGDFHVDRMHVGQRLILRNPLTNVLIDQTNRNRQPSDVQLYTGGREFSLSLAANRVSTDALVIGRKPVYEIISPDGSTSVVEQSEATFRNGRNSMNPALNFTLVVGDDQRHVDYEIPAVSLNENGDRACPEGDSKCETK